MKRSRVLANSQALSEEFARCCGEYHSVHVAVAWCGNPTRIWPYKHLENLKGRITATIGISFYHTHPDSIKFFHSLGANVRVFSSKENLFHPKIYLFTSKSNKRYALFVGSSNLTYNGFYGNIEVNSLIEGEFSHGKGSDIRQLQKLLKNWHSPSTSLNPDSKWLKQYRKDFNKIVAQQRKYNIPLRDEEQISTVNWLRHADWSTYYGKILEGRNVQGYHNVLDAVKQSIPTPWNPQYFNDIEKRRIIGGMKPYGCFGHVAAAGLFRKLLANGSQSQWTRIVSSINNISKLNQPIPWTRLTSFLNQLVNLGHTMKVWGRLLCIVRPDLYCTISSDSVRKKLSTTLGVPQNRFNTPEGYVQLIKWIHASSWFNSEQPQELSEMIIWGRRVAILDAVLY